jgi:hypothetical protein
MIPKIIHYCWLSNNLIPDDLQKYMASWKEKLSGYKFVLWNFDRFDINTSLWVKQAFEAKKYAFAADFIRLFAIYNCGGIYLDMDVEVIRPFDNLLQNNIMIAYEDNKTKNIEAGCFGAEKGHPFIKECLEYFTGREFSIKLVEDGYTLPRVMKKMFNKSLTSENLSLYTSDYFTAKNFRTGIIRITDNTHTIHHFASSWFTEMEKKQIDTGKKVVSVFGNNILSIVIILLVSMIGRIKRHGFIKTFLYYTRNIISH